MMRPCDGNEGVFLRAGFTPAGGLRLWIRRRRGQALRLWVAGATAGAHACVGMAEGQIVYGLIAEKDVSRSDEWGN